MAAVWYNAVQCSFSPIVPGFHYCSCTVQLQFRRVCFYFYIYVFFFRRHAARSDELGPRRFQRRANSVRQGAALGRRSFCRCGCVRQARQACRDPHGVLCCRGWAFRHPQKARPLSTSPRVGLICLVLLLPAFSFAPHKSRWNCLPWLTMPSALGSVLHLSRLPSSADLASSLTRLPFL